MPVIDEEGRLFGYVNVIDALVVVFLVAVAIAGLALVFDGGASASPSVDTPENEYATLVVGPLSNSTASALATTDNLTINETDTTLTVADVALTPHPGRDAVVAIVRVRPPDGDATRLNRTVQVTDGRLTYSTTLSGLTNSSTITRERTSLVVETTVADQTGETLEIGDEYAIGPTTVATITEKRRTGLGGDSRRFLLVLAVQTVTVDGTAQYARRPLRLGTSIPFRTESYAITGDVVSRNGTLPPSQTTTVRAETTVSSAVAADIDTGDAYRVDGRTVGRIDSVRTYPTATQGQRRVAMTLSLETTVADGTPQFFGTPVRFSTSVPFETAAYEFDATVVGFGESPRGTPTEATLTVEWDDVDPNLADAVSAGLSETHRGAQARITDVVREPATVVLRTESGDIYARDHPVNEDVTLTLSVQARQNNDRLYFHGRPVRSGDSVVLDFGSVTVDGTVVDASANT